MSTIESNFFDKLNAKTLTKRLEVLDYEDESVEDGDEDDMSTQFLRNQINQLIDLKQHLERYVNTLPVFGFNCCRYDLNLIKTSLIPYLICDREIEPTVNLKKKQMSSYHPILEMFGSWA